MAETVTVGELLVRLKADVTQLEAGLRKGQMEIGALETKARPKLGRLENSLRMVGISAAGLPGPIGRVASALSALLPGGLLTAGVLGVLGSIALALKIHKERAEEAAKAQAKFNDELAKYGLRQPTPFDVPQVAPGSDAGAFVLARWRQRRGPLLREFQREDLRLELERALEQLQDLRPRMIGPGDFGFERIQHALTAGATRARRAREEGLITAMALPDIKTLQERLQAIMKRVPQRLAAAKELQEKWKQLGEAIGDWVAFGLMSIFEGNFKGFLKYLAGNLLSLGLRVGFGALFGALAPAAAAVGSGKAPKKVNPGVGIRQGVDFKNFPPATNPLAAARDHDWQRFLRESNLVAASQGFRA